MMEEYDKLILAVKLVALNQLDENRDDTLIEKLLAKFDFYLTNKTTYSNEQLNSIYNFCDTSVDNWIVDKNKIFIGPVFNFYFNLISSFNAQKILEKDKIISSANKLIKLKELIFNNFDFSVQSYYILGISKLLVDENSSIIFLTNNIFDYELFKFLIKNASETKSFFVKKNIQNLIVQILLKKFDSNKEEFKNFLDYTFVVLEKNLENFHLNVLIQLLSKKDHKDYITTNYPQLSFQFISYISKELKESSNLLLIECIVYNLNDDVDVNFIFTKLIKQNFLKLLTSFTNLLSLKDKTFINKWFTFVVLPFELEIDGTSQNDFEYTDLEKNFIKSNLNEKVLLYCLHCLKNNFPVYLSKNQTQQVLSIIKNFVNYMVSKKKIKLLRESLSVVGNLSLKFLNSDKTFISISIEIIVDLLWSNNQFQCECLIWLRKILASYLNFTNEIEIKNKILSLLEKTLVVELKNENIELIDGGLEILNTLCSNQNFNLNELTESTLKHLISIIEYSKKHDENFNLKASCLLFILKMNIYFDEDFLIKIGFEKKNVYMNLFWDCLKNENSLIRKKVLESIKVSLFNFSLDTQKNDNIELNLVNLNLFKEYFDEIFYFVSEMIIFEIDTDIQLLAIHLLFNLIKNLVDKIEYDNFFKNLTYVIHSFHFILTNKLIEFSVKKQCVEKIKVLREILNENLIDKLKYKEFLKKTNFEPKFEYKINFFVSENENTNDSKHNLTREDHLNEMFEGNIFKTEHIINEFINKNLEKINTDNKTDNHIINNKVNGDELIKFFFDFNEEDFFIQEIKVDVLDDILAAKANDDIIIDCY